MQWQNVCGSKAKIDSFDQLVEVESIGELCECVFVCCKSLNWLRVEIHANAPQSPTKIMMSFVTFSLLCFVHLIQFDATKRQIHFAFVMKWREEKRTQTSQDKFIIQFNFFSSSFCSFALRCDELKRNSFRCNPTMTSGKMWIKKDYWKCVKHMCVVDNRSIHIHLNGCNSFDSHSSLAVLEAVECARWLIQWEWKKKKETETNMGISKELKLNSRWKGERTEKLNFLVVEKSADLNLSSMNSCI